MLSGTSLTAELSAVTYLSLPLALPSRIGSFAFPVGATGSVIDGVFPMHPGHRPLVSHLLSGWSGSHEAALPSEDGLPRPSQGPREHCAQGFQQCSQKVSGSHGGPSQKSLVPALAQVAQPPSVLCTEVLHRT